MKGIFCTRVEFQLKISRQLLKTAVTLSFWMNLYTVDNAVCFPVTYICVAIYPVHNAVQRLNNQSLIN